jgi:hypothetical protein
MPGCSSIDDVVFVPDTLPVIVAGVVVVVVVVDVVVVVVVVVLVIIKLIVSLDEDFGISAYIKYHKTTSYSRIHIKQRDSNFWYKQ